MASLFALALALTIAVVDPSGAVLVGATVQVVRSDGSTIEAVTGPDGSVRIPLPSAERVRVRVESGGFEPAEIHDLDVRRDMHRTVKMQIAKVRETVDVGRDPRERATDPRDAFAAILGAAEIQELPDDPDEMERVLREMAGPGAVLRVNGFRGGRLPPKDQIAQIRFRRNMFAADTHEPGFLAVDILTRPGLDAWRGSSGFAYRDDALNARNAFAPERGDERAARGTLTLSGPLWKEHTSLSLSVDGTGAYDSQTIVAATLAGAFSQSVKRPNDAANVTARVEHALTRAQLLRVEMQQLHGSTSNLGVGQFDLQSRAYRQVRSQQILRASLAGAIARSLFNELRVSRRSVDTTDRPSVQAPAVVVLDAFTSGGAPIDGDRAESLLEMSDDLDIARGPHSIRTGVLVEHGRYRTSEMRNALGTFTFADLAAYAAQRPTTFTRTVGDPRVAISQTQVGSYVQDDLRISPGLTVSAGVRQEYQSNVGGLHLGPRLGFAWSPFRSGRTTVRGGAGVFFDWFEGEDYLRALQTDGTRQVVETILAPEFPDVENSVPAARLARGRTEIASALDQPMLREMSVGVEQALGPVRLTTTLVHRRGSHLLRGVDVNAPIDGARPDPLSGPVTEIRSTARSSVDALNINLNIVRPERRVFVAAAYSLSRSIDETDSPFSLPADAAHLDAERGPSPNDARHRAMGFASFPIGRALSAGISLTARSALPYDITTGRDDNGDSLSRDRPPQVTRNTGRGSASVDAGARIAWRIGFGGPPAQGPAGPQVRIVRSGDNPLENMPGGTPTSRASVELYAQVFNALNHFNAQAFSGVQLSPFFGRPTSAGAPRRMEVGVRLAF